MNFNQTINHLITLAKNDTAIDIVWLYGSQVTGNTHINSDVDIAIAYHDFSLSLQEKQIRPQLTALVWAESLKCAENKISCVDINLAPNYLTYSIINNGKVLFCRNSYRQMKEEQRISSTFEFLSLESKIFFEENKHD